MFISEYSVGTDFESFYRKSYRVQHGKVMKQWTMKMNNEQLTMNNEQPNLDFYTLIFYSLN